MKSLLNVSGMIVPERRHDVHSCAEITTGRFGQVIGDGLRSRTDERRATEVEVAVHAFNRMLAC